MRGGRSPTGRPNGHPDLNRGARDPGANPRRPKERRALHFRFHEGMTQREIGEAIGVSQMQVLRLLRSGLGKLLVAVRGGEEIDPARVLADPRSPASERAA